MIPLIQKTLGRELQFIKYSTPNSGRTLDGKVILLGFEPGRPRPTLCIKTVRTYAAREVIARGFANLKKLNELTRGSSQEKLFPHALQLYDDGEHIFSVETATPGARVRLTSATLRQVIAQYTDFQAHIAGPVLSPVDDFAQELLTPALRQHYDTLPASNLRLPRVVQLGDLTEDNLLLAGSDLTFVDFDRVGEIDLPGFDLVGLLWRYDGTRAAQLVREHLPVYLARVGARGSGPYDRLLFLWYAAERTLRKTPQDSPDTIIADFARILV